MKGFSVRNLNYMAQFSENYIFTDVQPVAAHLENNENEILQPVAAIIQTGEKRL